MSWRQHGRAKVSARSPSAWGVCDRCGRWYLLDELRFQYDWRGNRLQDLYIRVCDRCNDKPQEQLRPQILPPDPMPRTQPRPEAFAQDDNLQGFTYYTFEDQLLSPTKTGVLADIAAASDIDIPTITDVSSAIAQAGVTQNLLPASATQNRVWFAVFNPGMPGNTVLAMSTGNAGLTIPQSMTFGPGGCYFWASTQNQGTPWQGALTITGNFTGAQYWLWVNSGPFNPQFGPQFEVIQ